MSAQVAEPELTVPPAYVYRPPRVRSMAGQLAALAERLGRPLDPEQVFALDVVTGERADGRSATLGAAIVAPRQNIKSWSFELIALGRLLRPDGDKLIVWSAHEVSTAQNNFRDLQELIETHSWLARRVTKVSQANGKEGIQFAGGRWLRFKARIQTGGRGLSGDCVILDEAFALRPEHMGALLPILSTRHRAAVFYGSSAGLLGSAILRGIRDRGRAGGQGAPAYVEWCAPGSFADPGCGQERCAHAVGTPGCVLDREDYWLAANLAAAPGRRITLEYLREERGELPPAEFARERLGWWEDPAGDVVDLEAWSGLVDEASRPKPRPVALAVDVAPGLTSAAVAAAGYRPDGLVHLELLAHRPGVAWLGEFLAARQKATGGRVWHVGGTSPVNAVVPDWPQHLDVEAMTVTEYAAACGALDAMVRDRRLRHLGDPILAGALGGAARKDVGDGAWVLRRSASLVDICPAVAVAVAVRGLVSLPASVGEPLVAWR